MVISRRFLLAIGGAFCILYVLFLHQESSYDFSNAEAPIAEVPVPKIHPAIPYKIAIILNCEGRSGSTWLSSFFWNNPNVFYVYEPLFPSPQNSAAMEQASLEIHDGHIHQLSDSFKCKIGYSQGETIFPMVLGRYPDYQPFLKHCNENGNCPSSLTSYCNSKSHIVQKVIRVSDISKYADLQKKLDIPLKIIHLIRDPRPHIMSREKLFTHMYDEEGPKYNQLSPEEKSKQRQMLCMRELNNIKLADSGFLTADNYVRLSHEEMSVEPVKWARKLYEFVGLEFTPETETYIGEITHGKSLVHDGKDPDGRYAGFSVYRDTLTILYKWMSTDPKHIHEIETECSELLQYLNYVPIYNDKLDKISENPWPNIVIDHVKP